MRQVLKFNLNGGLKRMVSTLICLMMVLATFPIHMLKDTVRADAGAPINLELGGAKDTDATVGNGSEVKDWMDGALKEDNMAGKGDINITLSNDIEVASDVVVSSLPTMSASASTTKYLFDFTDGRFKGKTITIDGGNHTIKIDNKDLFFLNLKDCRVILKNITIDGGWKGLDANGADVTGGSFIYVSQPTDAGEPSELEIEEGTTIQNCKNSSGDGGAIWNDGMLTINGGNITNCSAGAGSTGAPVGPGGLQGNGGTGGAIWNGGTLTINGGNITNCSAGPGGKGGTGGFRGNGGTGGEGGNGGAIWNDGTLTINGGSILSCSAGPGGKGGKGGLGGPGGNDGIGDAIYSSGTLNLPPKEFGFLTITLAKACCTKNGSYTGIQQCNHNDNPQNRMGYEGILNSDNTINENPNRKIVFVDSKSNSTVGFAYGKGNDSIAVPDRPGYEFVAGGLSYTKGGAEQDIAVTDGKFTLTDDMLGTAVSGVVTVKVKYNKLYTVQYVCDGKVVGTKSGCSENTTFSDIINTDFSKISLDGDQKLKDVVKPATGYKFSNFTYGNGQTYTAGTTKWVDLAKSAIGSAITVFLNYTGASATDTVKYVASGGYMILDKKSKLANYSGVNLPIGGLKKVHEPKKVIFDFCGQTIHHNDPSVPFIQGVPGKCITICNLKMDGSGCK